jgi:hypothetical protein
LYEHLENTILQEAPIDYLEFGVADGASLMSWLSLHRDADSRFWGFDSFERLPEDWYNDRPKGTFARGGRAPDISDPLLSFVVGWFQETLPPFLLSFKPQARLIVHNDSDLYSATLFTLTQLDSIAAPRTIVIFDEILGRQPRVSRLDGLRRSVPEKVQGHCSHQTLRSRRCVAAIGSASSASGRKALCNSCSFLYVR